MNRTWWKNLVKRKVHVARKRRSRRLWLEELEVRCQPSVSGFSPIDEVGNNAANPTLGTAGTNLLRLSPADYKPVANGGDGLNTPSLTYGAPTEVAGPRLVSNDVSNQASPLFSGTLGSTDINTVDGNSLSDFGYTFGQFMDHDLDLTPTQSSAPPPAPNTNKDGVDGFPIPADPTHTNDPINTDTLVFTRSIFDPTTGITTPRQQINVSTSFLDLSQVYGSTAVVNDALRAHAGGLLKSSPGADGITNTADDLLPFNNLTYFSQAQLDALGMGNDVHLVTNDQLFAAGDPRANETTELTSLQTLFMRNHNALARKLATLDPTQFGFTSWTDDNLFNEARKINIAEYQNIIYTQYLPALLGPTALPAYSGYDSTVDPSIATEFSTVGFRFGHSMLNNTVARDANDGSSVGDIGLAVSFFNPTLLTPGGVDPFGNSATDIGAVLKGDADNGAQALDVMAVSSIRNLLFGAGGQGEDLIARDIWRADDHGIGTYNQVRVAFGLAPITDSGESATGILPGDPGFRFHGFEQISSDPTVVQKLITAYTGPTRALFLLGADGIAGTADDHFAGDINPFVAGLAEDHVPGSDMGPLFTAILKDQFTRLRSGDRFFYLNESWNLQELALGARSLTLGQIIKNNTNVTNLQFNVFKISTLIEGRVFLDNNPSRPSFLDPGVAGITVDLLDASGNVIATTVTDQYGFYTFNAQSGVDSTGLYSVVLDLSSTNYTQVTANPGQVDITSGGTIVLGVDFGIKLT